MVVVAVAVVVVAVVVVVVVMVVTLVLVESAVAADCRPLALDAGLQRMRWRLPVCQTRQDCGRSCGTDPAPPAATLSAHHR